VSATRLSKSPKATIDTDFSDIDSWSDVTDSYGSSEVTLDSTVSQGTVYAISYDVVLTNGEVSAIESAAGGVPDRWTPGTAVCGDKIISIPGGIVAAVLTGSSVSRSPAEGRRMSASDALPSGDSPSPNSVLTGTIAFLNGGSHSARCCRARSSGRSCRFTGGINIIQSGIALVVAPLDALANTVDQAVASLILAPLGIIETTANTSGSSGVEQFGVFSILVGVGLVLATYWSITKYLEPVETSDTLPIPGLRGRSGFLPLGVTERTKTAELIA